MKNPNTAKNTHAFPINTPLNTNSVFKNHLIGSKKVKPWVRKTRLSYLNPFKLGAFLSPWWGKHVSSYL
ncbi:hypothetical protein N204_07300 [Helicobacter pylori UM085]|nr:hypothetical protein N204_07300 [Helicobacter pylori UM085]